MRSRIGFRVGARLPLSLRTLFPLNGIAYCDPPKFHYVVRDGSTRLLSYKCGVACCRSRARGKAVWPINDDVMTPTLPTPVA